MRNGRFILGVLFITVPLCAQPRDTKPIDSGGMWKSWTLDMRIAYIDGYVSGANRVYWRAFNYLGERQRQELQAVTFVVYDHDVLAKVVTDLYRDAANTYIEPGALVTIAREKIKGTYIEPLLRSARRNDVTYTDR